MTNGKIREMLCEAKLEMRLMYKKVLIPIVLVSVLLTGCTGGSYTIRIGELSSSSHSISGEYDLFSGYYFKEVKFAKGDTVQFTYSVSTEQGSLSARLLNSSGKVIKDITSDTTVLITKSDTYKVRVDGQKHQGNFNISWSRVKND